MDSNHHNHNHKNNCSRHLRLHHHHRHNHHHYHHHNSSYNHGMHAAAHHHACHCVSTPIFNSSRARPCSKQRIPAHERGVHHEPIMVERTIRTPSPTSPIAGHIASQPQQQQIPHSLVRRASQSQQHIPHSLGRRRQRSISNERIRNESRRRTAARDDLKSSSDNRNIEIHHYHHSNLSNLNSIKESCSLM